ncbi:hypothetical protein GCM10023144_03690 [Pigmentiphaga soli]|uniref:NlpC/P60 domain-containing protein n=1 Tax=Pigmentiphaga soli TaxID=1007095 RepID=A0ABP8GF42_9BURK
MLAAAVLIAAGLAGCASVPSPGSPQGQSAQEFSSPQADASALQDTPLLGSDAPAWRGQRRPGAAYGRSYRFDPGAAASLDPARILNGELPPDTPHDASPASSELNAELATYALGYLGVRYRSGGSSPESGFDCSGLVGYVSRKVLGLNLPRRAEDMSHVGEQVDMGDLQPGDLVFYNTLRRKFSHVGIYLGDGRFVHSPASGGRVRIESMDLAYWKARFNGARRLAAAEAALP